jgi:hypothetical protein
MHLLAFMFFLLVIFADNGIITKRAELTADRAIRVRANLCEVIRQPFAFP